MNFNLKINNNSRELTFFSIPVSNDYQQITNLSYGKSNCQLVTDSVFTNKILVVKGDTVQKIKFGAIFKLQKIDLGSGLKFPKNKGNIRKDKFINGEDLRIKKIADSLKNANLAKTIQNSYEFVIDYLTYGNPQVGLYSFEEALEKKTTDCGGFSTLLASILNANQIQTRLVVGFLLKNNQATKLLGATKFNLGFGNLLMHAWLEALLSDGRWFPLDPSIDWKRRKGLTTRKGGFGFIPNDRLVTSFGQDFHLKISDKSYEIALLQNPVKFKAFS